MALALEGAAESAHMGHPDFRAHGRIFATLHHDRKFAMVVLTPDQQQRFMDTSAAFTAEAGAWGRGGSTRIDLHAADEETVGEALTLAWQNMDTRAKAKRPTSVSAPRAGAARKVAPGAATKKAARKVSR